jgi:hypothetical protein
MKRICLPLPVRPCQCRLEWLGENTKGAALKTCLLAKEFNVVRAARRRSCGSLKNENQFRANLRGFEGVEGQAGVAERG